MQVKIGANNESKRLESHREQDQETGGRRIKGKREAGKEARRAKEEKKEKENGKKRYCLQLSRWSLCMRRGFSLSLSIALIFIIIRSRNPHDLSSSFEMRKQALLAEKSSHDHT